MPFINCKASCVNDDDEQTDTHTNNYIHRRFLHLEWQKEFDSVPPMLCDARTRRDGELL